MEQFISFVFWIFLFSFWIMLLLNILYTMIGWRLYKTIQTEQPIYLDNLLTEKKNVRKPGFLFRFYTPHQYN